MADPNRAPLDEEFTEYFQLLHGPTDVPQPNPVETPPQTPPPPGTTHQAPREVLEAFYQQVEQDGPRPDRPPREQAVLGWNVAPDHHRQSSADPVDNVNLEEVDLTSLGRLQRMRTAMAAARAATAAALRQATMLIPTHKALPRAPLNVTYIRPETLQQSFPPAALQEPTHEFLPVAKKDDANNQPAAPPAWNGFTPASTEVTDRPQRVPGSTDMRLFTPPPAGTSVVDQVWQEFKTAEHEPTREDLTELQKAQLLGELLAEKPDEGRPLDSEILERILSGLRRL